MGCLEAFSILNFSSFTSTLVVDFDLFQDSLLDVLLQFTIYVNELTRLSLSVTTLLSVFYWVFCIVGHLYLSLFTLQVIYAK